jgi:hypothetical protein
MPIARVEMPDGRIARLEVPEGTTPQQVEAFVLESVKGRRAPDAIERSAMAAMKPTKLERFGRGFADVTQGLKQLGLQGKDLVTGGNEAEAYTKEKSEELARYERGRGPDAGVDWMRLGGNIVATAPISLLPIPGPGAATVGARVAAGAAQGAASSGSMFTPEGESKLSQTLIGAGVGAAVPAALEGIRRAVRSVSGVTRGQVTLPDLRGEISFELKKQGIDFGKLTKEVQESLLADAQAAVRTGGTVDPVQLARKADIEAVGAKGTRAAVTRDPKDWRTMQNLRGVDNVGEGIAKRQADDAAALTSYLEQLKSGTGAKAATPLEAGESAISAFKGVDALRKSGVDRAYTAARDNLGRAAPMDTRTFSQAANNALDEQMLGSYLPAEVRSMLNKVSAGEIPFNVNTAVQMDSVLSAAQRSAGKGSPQALAIGKVRDALNAAPIESNVGEDAKQAFDAARRAAAMRFKDLDATPAMKAAVEDVSPDKFVQKFILGADAKSVRNAVNFLRSSPEGTQAIADIKGTVLDNLLLKATGATNVDDLMGRPFSGRNFAKALDAIPPEKLHVIFTPSEMDALRTLQRASKYLTEEVPFSDVNHSKTAAALANVLQKIGNTPLLGQALSPIIGVGKIGMDWVKDAGQRRAVAGILLTSARQGGKAMPAQLPAPSKLSRLAPAGSASALYVAGQNGNQPQE